MAYGKRHGRGEMYATTSKAGSSRGDGYTKAPEDKSWSSGTGNVKESRLNSGGDKRWVGTRNKKAKMAY